MQIQFNNLSFRELFVRKVDWKGMLSSNGDCIIKAGQMEISETRDAERKYNFRFALAR